MDQIIDIHSHILPGIDDGASSWEESREMLSMAYEQGIHTIIATPHFSRQQDPEKLRRLVLQLDDEAKKISSGFNIYSGNEIMYFDSMIDYIKSKTALTLADSGYVLVEFMPDVRYRKLFQGVRKILLSGYIPVIAHIERYPTLQKADRLQELTENGCYLQMNYSSINGSAFDSSIRWCRKRLLDEQVHFLGTDMHHINCRTPRIDKSLKWLGKKLDDEQIRRLTSRNAEKILVNQAIN